MKVVLDTNVLVSGTFWTGDSFKILRRIDLKEITFVLSKELLDEYDETIHKEDIVEMSEFHSFVTSGLNRSWNSDHVQKPHEVWQIHATPL